MYIRNTNKELNTAQEFGYKQCKAKMLHLLNARDYTEYSMRQKLTSAGFHNADIDNAIKEAISLRLIDDARYAELFVRTKKEVGWGQNKIKKSLADKGVDLALMSGYPENFFSEPDEVDRAIRCLSKHRTTAKNKREAHFRFLVARGFTSSVASKALAQRVANTGSSVANIDELQ